MAAGDRGAFALLYDRYCRQVYSLARRVCWARFPRNTNHPKLMAEIDHTPQAVQPSTPDTPPAVAPRHRSRALLAAAAAIVIALGVSTTVLGIQVANRAQAWSTANPWR
ncbi:MAG TPA: hypothetical protein VL652_06840 [Kutzneria sp.]|nr:hypothetical protein [Kutzneria sp.]